MLAKEKIVQRIEKLKLKYLKKYYKKYFSRIPENCKYNHQQKQLRKTTGEVLIDPDTLKPITVGLCMMGCNKPDDWKGSFCMYKETAESCPFFTDKYSKTQIRSKFEEELRNRNIRAEKYKDLHELYLIIKPGEEDEDLFRVDNLLSEIDSLQNEELTDLREMIIAEVKARDLEQKVTPNFDFQSFFNIIETDDLRKLAQLIISSLEKRDDSDIDQHLLNKDIWKTEDPAEEDSLFENGL